MQDPSGRPTGGHEDPPQERPATPGGGWSRWLQAAVPRGSGFESTRYLTKWMLLGTAIGVVAGLGAIAFYLGIQLVTDLALGRVVGYLPPSPVGEGTTGVMRFGRPWLLPLIAALGGLLSGVIVFSLAPEAEGHGTDAAIEAIHHEGGRIRARIPPIKLIASAITIGTGGSGGREGPAAQISAGFGSLLGRWLGLDGQDRRIAVSAGIGAGIGAIFRAPLGGAILAAEILYVHDLEVEAIIPALIAAIVGYAIYGASFGYAPIFGPHTALALGSPIQLAYYALLGVICGLVGILYARSFYGARQVFHRLRIPDWVKPGVGGLLVGSMGLVVPGSLHMGYGWVQIAMGPGLLSLPLWMVLALPFAKILSTSFSISSGGSGGVFGPGMVIGGMLGASFWRLAHGVLPAVPPQPSAFVIVGMMALFGGIAHAPLSVMLMVAEMTGNLSLLAPAMVAVAVSTALVGDNTIYRSQLPNRASAHHHRLRFSFPLLSSLLVRDAMAPPAPIVRVDAPLGAAEALLSADRGGVVALEDGSQEFAGLVTSAGIARVPPDDRGRTLVRAALAPAPVVLSPETPLDAALEQLAEAGVSRAPVVRDRRLLGELHVRDAIRTYRAMLHRGVRRASGLPANISYFEVRVSPRSALAGRTLAEAALPRGTLIIAITRDGETLFPLATTRIEAGDMLMVMADRESERTLAAFLGGNSSPASG